MKKISSALIGIFLISNLFGQDITTLTKLHDISESLGIANTISIDSVIIFAKKEKVSVKVLEPKLFLLRAAEYYSNKDYENSIFYIKKIRGYFRFIDYNNLKYAVLIGSYANMKDINNTAMYLYIVRRNQFVDPKTTQIIQTSIRNNFTKDNFEKVLSYYFYYHERQKVMSEIKFDEKI